MKKALRLMLVLVPLIVPGSVHAQWTVKITPTLNPLPIGLCAAVRIEVTDATGQIPRNSAGNRVTIADFDLSVTAANPAAVAGIFYGVSNWSVCACQKATVGAVATVTASYPAAAMAQANRVSGAETKASQTFTIGKAANTVDQPACKTPVAERVKPASGATSSASTKPPTTQPASAPPLATKPPTTPTAPTSARPSGSSAATGNDAVLAPAGAAAASAKPLPRGPAPASVTVKGTATETVVTWTIPDLTGATSRPTGYKVERWKSGDPDCCRAASPTLTTLEWRDSLTQPGMWRYRVTALYSDGLRGSTLSDNYAYTGKD